MPTVEQTELLALYDRALPEVYGYLARRCDSTATAEDLTSDTFLVAVAALQREPDRPIDTGWLIGTARHKLIDHWRRGGRQRNALAELWGDMSLEGTVTDPHDEPIDVTSARQTLARLTPLHRAVRVLRYCDGLTVGEVARAIERSVHATESLLTRAKVAFRQIHRSLDREDP